MSSIAFGDKAKGMPSKVHSSLFEIPIRKKSIIYIELVYVLVVFFLVNCMGLPYAAVYVTDIINCIAIAFALKEGPSTFRRVGYGTVVTLFLVFCAALLLSDVMNAVSIPLVVWAIRNTFRFFGFFFACVVLLDMSDVKRLVGMLFAFQWVNLVVSMYQFAFLGLSQDNLGGIFGSAAGCNAYSNVFFCILLVYYSLFCLSGKEPIWKLLFVCVSTLALAAMAELKFYYFEFVAIMLVAVLIHLSKVRAFVIAGVSVVALAVGLHIFAQVFPSAYETIINFDETFSYSSQGMAGYELSRFGAFGEISDLIFNNDPLRVLLGIGFGGAEFSSNIAAFVSPFSQIWGYLNYRWFAHQMWFIEVGSIGFGLFVALFVSHCIYSVRQIKRSPQYKTMLQFVAIFTVVTIANLWYNCSVRIEVGYLIFFVLAISCIVAKEDGSPKGRLGGRYGD